MQIRTGDISFVIDHAINRAISDNPDPVYALIDATQIGVTGHSLGGSAALGIGRTRGDVGAVVALESPFLCDIVGVDNGEFVWNEDAYPVSVLNICSDSSWSDLDEWPQYTVNSRLLVDADATAYSVHMQRAGHLTLTDLALTSPFLTRMFDGHTASIDTRYYLTTIDQLALGFFDCYLKGKGEFAPQAVHGEIEQQTQCQTYRSEESR